MPRKQWTVLLVLGLPLVLALGLLGCMAADKPVSQEASPPVTLSVRSVQDDYDTGEDVRLVLSLANTGTAETSVSDMLMGNIRIVSLRRDGEDVATRTTPIRFIVPLSARLKESLVVLRPGENVEIPWSAEMDPGLGHPTLRTVGVTDDGEDLATFYELGFPGRYALEVEYEYSGPANADHPRVFRGPTNRVGVAFNVRREEAGDADHAASRPGEEQASNAAHLQTWPQVVLDNAVYQPPYLGNAWIEAMGVEVSTGGQDISFTWTDGTFIRRPVRFLVRVRSLSGDWELDCEVIWRSGYSGFLLLEGAQANTAGIPRAEGAQAKEEAIGTNTCTLAPVGEVEVSILGTPVSVRGPAEILVGTK